MFIILLGVPIVEAALIDGLDAYYSFEQSSGSVLPDKTVNGHDGTLLEMEDEDWVAGKLGNALQFDGVNEWVNVTNGIGGVADYSEYSWSVWVLIDAEGTAEKIIAHHDLGSSARSLFLNPIGGEQNKTYSRNSGTDTIGDFVTGVFTHMVVTAKEGDKIELYIDGVSVANSTFAGSFGTSLTEYFGIASENAGIFFAGKIDELGYWNRTLTNPEVLELFNNGNAKRPDGLSSIITVDLISPTNQSVLPTTGTNFTTNYTMDEFNLTNVTYNIWFDNGTLINQTNLIVLGNSSAQNSSTLLFDNLVAGDYLWNVEAFGDNSTGSFSFFAENNFTFSIIPFTVIDQIWKNDTVEGSLDLFSLEIEVDTGTQVSTANLIYDGSIFAGIINDKGSDIFNLTRELIIPSVAATINKSFFWQIILDDGFQFNTSSVNQSVLNLDIDDCTTQTLVILNYTLVDEENQIQMNLTNNGTIDLLVELFSADLSTQALNFSKSFTNTNNATVCLAAGTLDDASYALFTTVKYSATGYVPEFHHIQNQTLSASSTPINITLFDLQEGDNTNFLITFKDENFLPVEGALINVQRNYIGEGLFKSVEIPKTDTNGKAVGHFDTEGVAYTISVTKNSQVLAIFENVVVVCTNEIIGECNINLNIFSSSSPIGDWGTYGNISLLNTFDESTRTITTIFNTGTGTTTNITVIAVNFDRFGNNTVCSSSLVSSAGTLTCLIPQSFGNATVVHRIFKDGVLIRTEVFKINEDFDAIFQGNQIIMILVLMMTIPLMMISSPIGLLVGVAIGLIMASSLLIFNGGTYLGPASMIIWVLASAGVIIWKIASKE